MSIKKYIAQVLLKPVLRLHSWSYRFGSRLSLIHNNGIHPKHDIVRYEAWFKAHIEKGWTVLDIGSHEGGMARYVADTAHAVYGIEIREAYIAAAREQTTQKNIVFIHADATQYDYAQCESIDCIILSNVLEHLDNRIAFLEYLTSQVPWKKAKRLLVRIPLITRDWITGYKKSLGLPYFLDDTHTIEYTENEIKNELHAAGFTIQSAVVQFGEMYCVACAEKKQC